MFFISSLLSIVSFFRFSTVKSINLSWDSTSLLPRDKINFLNSSISFSFKYVFLYKIFIVSCKICSIVFPSSFESSSANFKKNSLKSYLLKAVRNYCLDELRHRRIIDEHIAYELKSDSIDIDTTENYILYSDLCRQLKNALEQLPPQEREVFEMSRLENIKYQEIANRLNISVRTVEVRISKALKQLRILLKDFYLLLFLFLFH